MTPGRHPPNCDVVCLNRFLPEVGWENTYSSKHSTFHILPSIYGLNSTTTALQRWVRYQVTSADLYVFEQRNQTKPMFKRRRLLYGWYWLSRDHNPRWSVLKTFPYLLKLSIFSVSSTFDQLSQYFIKWIFSWVKQNLTCQHSPHSPQINNFKLISDL